MLSGFAGYWYNLAMKTKLFVDFDGTIFNTLALRKKMFEVFTMSGFDETEIKNTYAAESLDFKYSPEGQWQRLRKIHEFDEEKAKIRMDKLIKSSNQFLFDDFAEFVNKIDREKYELTLFTLGDINFQKDKIKNSGVVSFFDNVYYCEIQKWDFLEDIVEINEKFIIIDDRADVAERIGKKFKRSFPIFIDRSEKDLDDPALSSNSDYSGISVKNLKQAGQYL